MLYMYVFEFFEELIINGYILDVWDNMIYNLKRVKIMYFLILKIDIYLLILQKKFKIGYIVRLRLNFVLEILKYDMYIYLKCNLCE